MDGTVNSQSENLRSSDITDLLSIRATRDVLDLLFVPSSYIRHANWPRLRKTEGKHIGITYAGVGYMELARLVIYSELAYKIIFNESLIKSIYNSLIR